MGSQHPTGRVLRRQGGAWIYYPPGPLSSYAPGLLGKSQKFETVTSHVLNLTTPYLPLLAFSSNSQSGTRATKTADRLVTAAMDEEISWVSSRLNTSNKTLFSYKFFKAEMN